MKNNKLFNKEQIVSILILDKMETEIYKFKERKLGFLGFFAKESGFYTKYGEKLDSIPKEMIMNNGKLFYKDSILITYSNKEEEYIYFNSEEERNVYLKREFDGIKWLKR